MEGCCRLIIGIVAFFKQQQAEELVVRPQKEQFVMFRFSRLERVPHGSDLRLSSQNGNSRKEESPELLSNQLACG